MTALTVAPGLPAAMLIYATDVSITLESQTGIPSKPPSALTGSRIETEQLVLTCLHSFWQVFSSFFLSILILYTICIV